MRLLGNCPECDVEDEITGVDHDEFGPLDGYNIVQCGNCKTLWSDWFDLKWNEQKKGNILIPVEVERTRSFDGKEDYGVSVFRPRKREIPYSNLITSVLNSALLTRFNKLRVNFSTEGGIEGVYKRTYIELRNLDDRVGLSVSQDYIQGPGLIEVLDFYERLLRLTFEEPLRVSKRVYRRGEILRLPKDDQGYAETDKVWEILGVVLTTVKSTIFARKVVGRLIGESYNPFSGPYLRGLTDEEIARYFVPPP